MLLAVFPFIAAAFLYGLSCADLFRVSSTDVPSNWNAKLFLPVLVGTLTALTALAAGDGDGEGILLSVVAAGVLFSILVAAGLRGDAAFFDLQLLVGTRRRRFERLARWHLLLVAGLAIMVYGSVATLIAT